MYNSTELKYSDDETLIRLFLAGNERAWNTIYERYSQKVWATIRRTVNIYDDALDLFQESWLKISQALREGKHRFENKFIAWANRIATNVVIDFFRKKNQRDKAFFVVGGDYSEEWFENYPGRSPDSGQEDVSFRNAQEEHLRQLVKKLPIVQRQVIVYFYLGRLPVSDIAVILDSNVNTTVGRLKYARTNLRKMLEAESLVY